MHGNHLHPGAFGGARNADGVFMARRPAGAHLQRHRNAVRQAGGHHRLDDLQRQGFVLHQRRAGPLVADLFGRAAHVDVDDLRASVDVVGRGVGHHLRVGAGDLHRDWRGFALMVGAARGFQRVPQVAARGHHLADRIAGAELFAQLTKRPVGDAGHGRDKHIVRQGIRANVHEKNGIWKGLLKKKA